MEKGYDESHKRFTAPSEEQILRVEGELWRAVRLVRFDPWVHREIKRRVLGRGENPLRWWHNGAWQRELPPQTSFPIALIPQRSLESQGNLQPGETQRGDPEEAWILLSPLPPFWGEGSYVPHPASALAPHLGKELAQGVAEGKGEALLEAEKRVKLLAPRWGFRTEEGSGKGQPLEVRRRLRLGEVRFWDLAKALRDIGAESLVVRFTKGGIRPNLTFEALGPGGKVKLPRGLRKSLEDYFLLIHLPPWWLEEWNPRDCAHPSGETQVHLDLVGERARISFRAYTFQTEESLAFLPRRLLRKALRWDTLDRVVEHLPGELVACRGEEGWVSNLAPRDREYGFPLFFLRSLEAWLARAGLPILPRQEGSLEVYTCAFLDERGLEVVGRKLGLQTLLVEEETLPLGFIYQHEVMEDIALE